MLTLLILPAVSIIAGWGCKESNPGNSGYNAQITYSNILEFNKAVDTLQEVDKAISNRDLDKALNYFSDNATIEVKNPPYLRNREPVLSWTLPEFRVDPDTGIVSPKSITVDYSGKEAINRYLFSLIFLDFRSEYSEFNADGEKIIWTDNVAMSNYEVQMQFEALVDQDKVQSLVITFSNLVIN